MVEELEPISKRDKNMKQRKAGGRGRPSTASLTLLCALSPEYTREQVLWEMQRETGQHSALEELTID